MSVPAPAAVHDVLVTPLPPSGAGPRPILSFDDHLLRRFGSAQIVRLAAGETFESLRAAADEIWALLDGRAEFRLEDTRTFSPTAGVLQSILAESPTRVLVPFGVRLRVTPRPTADLLRFMTHTEGEDPPAGGGA